METINIDIAPQKNITYPIIIAENACNYIDDVLEKIPASKAILVTNTTIFKLYKDLIEKIIQNSKLNISLCILNDGEEFKNQKSIDVILTSAFDNKLERNDLLIAFGGGVIGDMTGYAASIYLRGINFLQIPTTLLAQVDSSVGGKVGINTKYGKNLLGAFYQPNAVISDLTLLNSLPEREILTGLAEVIKYSFIEKNCGEEFCDFANFLSLNSLPILELSNSVIEKIVKTSCELKASVVEQDEKESGLRAFLNFGHTLGHSIEKVTNYKLFTHGEAIAIGMRAVFKISLKMNKINEEYYDFAVNLLEKYKLNFKIPREISVENIFNSLIFDKKVKNGKIRFVLPIEYAKSEIFDDVPENVIIDTIKELY